MKVSTLVLALALGLFQNAFAQTVGDCCLTESTAMGVADNFEHLFQNYTKAFAQSVLSEDYKDWTDSVAWLMGNGTECPHKLGSVTFPNLKSLEMAQSMQPHIPWENINVFWNCKHIFVRWISRQHPQHVQGIAIVETEKSTRNNSAKIPYLMKTVYSEFNTGAWLVNRGDYNGTGVAPGCQNVSSYGAVAPSRNW